MGQSFNGYSQPALHPMAFTNSECPSQAALPSVTSVQNRIIDSNIGQTDASRQPQAASGGRNSVTDTEFELNEG